MNKIEVRRLRRKVMPRELINQAAESGGPLWMELLREMPTWPESQVLAVLGSALSWVHQVDDNSLSWAVLQTIAHSILAGKIDSQDLGTILYMDATITHQKLVSTGLQLPIKA